MPQKVRLRYELRESKGRAKSYLDGELGWVMRKQVQRHLAECEECRKEMSAMAELTEQVRSAEQASAPEGLRGRVLAGIEFEPAIRKPVWKSWAASAAVMAVSLAVVAMIVMPTQYRAQENARMSAKMATQTPEAKVADAPLQLAPKPIAESKAVSLPKANSLDKTITVNPDTGAAQPQMIIKTADMGVLVKDFDLANDSAIAIAKSAGGFVTEFEHREQRGQPHFGEYHSAGACSVV